MIALGENKLKGGYIGSTSLNKIYQGETLVWSRETQPYNEIWYTSTDGNIVTPYSVAFGDGVTVVSNTYENGKGVIVLSGDATRAGDFCFQSNANLKTISLPDSVLTIAAQAFQKATTLEEISFDKVETIEANAFDGCTSLVEIMLPKSVTSVVNYAFQNCSALTKVTLSKSLTAVNNYVFNGCTSLTSITIPDSVTSIGDSAFNGCSSLKSLTIPNSVTSLGNAAFDECTSLVSLKIGSGLTTLYGFNGCSSLESFTIPNTITAVGGFGSCSALTSITIPDSVTQLGSSNDSAFSNCAALTTVKIGSGLTKIYDYSFNTCPLLNAITIDAVAAPTLLEDDTAKFHTFVGVADAGVLTVPIGSLDSYNSTDLRSWKNSLPEGWSIVEKQALPDGYFFNINAADFDLDSKSWAADEDSAFNEAIVLSHGSTALSKNDDGSLKIPWGWYFHRHYSTTSENPINRNSSNNELTIIYKAKWDDTGDYSNIIANRDENYNWMARYTMFHTADSMFLYYTPTNNPNTQVIRVNASGLATREIKEDGNTLSGQVSWGDASYGFLVFLGYTGGVDEYFSGDFHYLFISLHYLTDEEVQDVIDFNEDKLK